MNKQNKTILSAVFVAAVLSLAGIALFSYSDTNVKTSESTLLPSAFSQESATASSSSLSENNPTIKVTGDSSTILEPDQAVIVIARHSQPTDIMTALAEQKQGTHSLIDAINDAVGEDSPISITMGHFGLDPYYMGGESYSNIDTFTVRSTTSVETDIDQFSNVVNRLTEEGYTFESVYANHRFSESFGYATSSFAGTDGGFISEGLGIEEEDIETIEDKNESNQITLNIAVSTKPASISDAVKSYEEKHQKLLEILTEEIGISHDKIQPANVDINPLYYGPANQDSIYNTYWQIFVKTSPENIEKVTTAAQEQEAFVENVMLSISDESLEQAQDQLNLEAFENAKTRAQKLSQMAGLDVGGVQSIESVTEPMEQRRTFHGGLYPIDQWRYYDSGEIGVSVTVEFELVQ